MCDRAKEVLKKGYLKLYRERFTTRGSVVLEELLYQGGNINLLSNLGLADLVLTGGGTYGGREGKW